jgi:hypothetical protein
MKRSLVEVTLAAFLASSALASAQHAVPRGGGGGGGSSPSGGGSHSSGGGSSDSGSSSGGGPSGFSGGDSGRAVPRHPTTTSSNGGGSRGGGDGVASGRGGRAYGGDSGGGAPATSRPQDGRPTTGYAVPRGTAVVPPGRPGGDYNYYPHSYNWYYNPWGYGTWGLGYIWDPFWFGPSAGYPIYGYGGGYGGSGYSGVYAEGGYAGDYKRDDEGEGSLRIKVKPREAKVTVDGFFAGTVDDFDGRFQKLSLGAGTHKVTLEAEGYEPLTFDVMIADGQTVNYKGELRKR